MHYEVHVHGGLHYNNYIMEPLTIKTEKIEAAFADRIQKT